MDRIKGFLVLFLVGVLTWLFFSARKGDTISIAILAVLAAIVLILVGVGITLAVLNVHYKREQARFAQNMQENLAIMSTLQRVQNQQNAMLLKQAKETAKALPMGEVYDVDALAMDESVFEELED
jgi:Flp pilus assembly protein TadB